MLIFDEVITGFRVAPGGAADRFGVTPDLATYGKAMAGGWPVSSVGPLRAQGLPVAFHVSFGDPQPIHHYADLQRLDLGQYSTLARALAEHGVWVADRGIWYVSTTHGDRELEAVVERFSKRSPPPTDRSQ